MLLPCSSSAIELRQRFPGITDNTQARACARIIAGWKPLPLRPVKRMPKVPGVSRVWGIMPRWLTARFGWHAAEIDGPILSRAFHCRPCSEPEAGDQHLFGTSASAAICSFAD
jgi:hypothetical protein